MKDNEKCNISHAPSHRLKQLQNVLESLDPEEPEKKHNNTERKSGRHFTAASQHLTPTVVIIKILVKVDPSRANKVYIFMHI